MKGNLTCPHKKLDDLSTELAWIINVVEAQLKMNLQISSGVRCEECNKKVEGKTNSAHLTGKALDIKVSTSDERYQLVESFIERGINRIGIGKDFIHIDIDKTKPQEVMWVY